MAPHPYRALSIAVGRLHTCALLEDHSVKCWGLNGFGELGYGDLRDRGLPSEMGDALPKIDLGTGRWARAIAAGHYATCALLDDATVKCWGLASLAGRTGTSLDETSLPMGDALAPLDLGAGRKATHIAVGHYISCAVLDDATARCWGDVDAVPGPGPVGASYPLGATSPVRQVSASPHGMVVLFEDGSVTQVPPDPGRAFVVGQKAVSVAGSRSGWGAVRADGSLFYFVTSAWSIPPPPSMSGLIDFGVGEMAWACSLSSGGAVRCWGNGMQDCKAQSPSPLQSLCGADGTIDLGQPATVLGTGGDYHECALLLDGSIKCWGENPGCATDDSGHETCGAASSPSLWLGGTAVKTENGVRVWPAVDLGTYR